MKRPLIIIFLVLLCDQALKFWIKLTFALGETRHVFGNWFQLLFIENNGLAFGLELGEGGIAKIALSVFRILAVIFLFIWLHHLTKKGTNFGPILGISLVTAGASGNLIDCLFYGLIFSPGIYGQIATWGSYAGFLHGRVVDMLYFPLFTFPEWMPFFGGQIFFSPIFNIADAAVTIGVLYLLIFQTKFLKTL